MTDEPTTPPADETGGRTDRWHEDAPADSVGALPRPSSEYQDIDWALVADVYDDPVPRRMLG